MQYLTHRFAHFLPPLVALLWAFAVHAAPIYKWTDENGRVHYGDQPPAGAPAQTIDLQTTVPAATGQQQARLEKRKRLLQAFEIERAEKREQARLREQERREACAVARRELRFVDDSIGLPMAKADENGNLRWVSDVERDAEHQRMREEVAKLCS